MEQGVGSKGAFSAVVRSDPHGRSRAAGCGPFLLGLERGPHHNSAADGFAAARLKQCGSSPRPSPKRKNPHPPFVRAEAGEARAEEGREGGSRDPQRSGAREGRCGRDQCRQPRPADWVHCACVGPWIPCATLLPLFGACFAYFGASQRGVGVLVARLGWASSEENRPRRSCFSRGDKHI